MAQSEEELLKGAIAGTQKEIFAAAFDEERPVIDDTGDTTREQMGEGLEGEIEPEEEAEDEAEGAEEGAEGDDKAKPEGEKDPVRDDKGKFAEKDTKTEPEKGTEPDPKPGKDHRVPYGEMKVEREKRQAAETERDALKAERDSAKSEYAKLEAKLDGFIAAQRTQPAPQPQQQKPESKAVPDMFADPEGYRAWQQEQVAAAVGQTERRLTERFIDASLAAASDVYKEKFDAAYKWIISQDRNDPSARATVAKIWNAPNPGAALMRKFREVETLREVGGDPESYREKLKTETRDALMKDPEFRKQLIDELKAEAGGAQDGRPRNITRLPKSLNGASGSGATHDAPLDGSQRAIFQSVWD